jgi:putative addiction module component (TIGR02574 family)
MKTISMADILQLNASERIQLVEAIWDNISIMPDAINLSDALRKELDRRLENHRRNPNAGSC